MRVVKLAVGRAWRAAARRRRGFVSGAVVVLCAALVGMLVGGSVAGARGDRTHNRALGLRAGARVRAFVPTRKELLAAARRARKAEHARWVWLHSPAVRAARAASRVEYRGLSSQAVASVAVHKFGGAFAGASATPATNAAVAGHVVRYVNSHEAIIRSGAKQRLAFSSLPLVSSRGGHGRAPVDLRLRAVAGGFAPENPLQPLLIGSRVNDGVAVGGDGLRFTMSGADVSARLVNGAGASFANVASDTDMEVAPTSTGVDLYAVLRSPRSPERLRYAVTLPPGASLRPVRGGAVVVVRDGKVLGEVLAPVALDAQGSSVPVKMSVVSSSLLLRVRHRQGSFDYPILVDPTYTVSATDQSGSWVLNPPVAWEDSDFDLATQYVLQASDAVPYNIGGGPESTGWEWYPPIAAGGPLSWTIYGADFADDDSSGVIPDVQLILACDTVDVYAGGTPLVGTLSYPNTGCGLNPSGPGFQNVIQTFSGDAHGDAFATFSGFLVTGQVSCSSDCSLDGGPITPQEGYGSGNASEATNECQWGPNPINCATGNFWHSFTDLTVPDRGLPLALARTYNSLDASTPGPFGYGWSSSYSMRLTFDSSGDATVHQEDGATVTFSPNGSGQFTAPPRVIATLVQNGDGTYTFTRRAREKFVFSSSGQLQSISDLDGDTNTLAYNGSGQLTSVSDAEGRQLTFAYGSNGDVSSVTDPAGRAVSYTYDSAGDLTKVTDPAGDSTSFTYDASHLVTAMKDPNGGTVSNTYNSSGKVVSQTDPAGRTTTFAYGTNTTSIRDPDGNETFETYLNGELANVTKGVGTSNPETWSYLYDPSSAEVAQATDPNGNVTQDSYDSSGNLTQKIDPLNRTTSYTYNSLDEPTSITDPSSETTTITYDSDGNETSISQPLTQTGQTQTTTFTYGDTGHPGDLTAVTDPDGNTTNYTYDNYGDETSATDALGNKTTYGYDSIGRVTSTVSPRGNVSGANPSSFTTTYGYDPDSRLTSEVGPLGQTQAWAYDGDGNLTSYTDANNHTTSYSYDADNELTSTKKPNSSTQTSGYDGDGQLTSQTDGNGHTTHYTYDTFGNLGSVTDPLSRKTTYAYDGDGNLTGVTDPEGRTTTNGYDADSELTSISYSDGKTANVTYAYNADGDRTSMTDGTGSSSYSYDSLGRLTSDTDGAGHQVSYGYDLANNLTSTTYPNGKTITRAFDPDEQLASVTDWLGNKTSFAYDPDSNQSTTTFPSATNDVDSYSYDDADQLTGIHMTQGSSTLASLSYTHDPDGLLTSDTETSLPVASSQSTRNYSYDNADNITELDGQSGYTYDNADELTSSPGPGPGNTYSYDQLGERTSVAEANGKNRTSYTYDQAGRLTAVTPPSGSPTTFAYNGDGLRTSKTTGSTASSFSWDQTSDSPLLLLDGTNSYIYGPDDLPIEQINQSGTPSYLHHDQLGSTRLITNQTGNTTATFTYNPYGALAASTGTATTPFGYAGQYTDPETGFQYDESRYYDPATGQFLTRDPLEQVTGQPYTYATDDPLNLADPSGQDAIPIPLELCAEDPVVALGCAGAAAGGGAILSGGVKVISDLFNWITGSSDSSSGNSDSSSGSSAGDAAQAAASELAAEEDCLMQSTLSDPLSAAEEGGSRGSTGRNVPESLNEQLALQEAESNPAAGTRVPIEMTDPHWPASEGWVKMAQNVNGIEIHYVYNTETGAADDFKFAP